MDFAEIDGWFGDKLREANIRREKRISEIGEEAYKAELEERRLRVEREKEAQEAKERSKLLLEKSGLFDAVNDLTFAAFETKHDYQKAMKEMCRRFTEQDAKRFLYLSGQPGCGKTHLGTALCGYFINSGRYTLYSIHSAIMKELKAHVNDEEYENVMYKYTSPTVLYIDDFMKPVEAYDEKEKRKRKLPPTASDVKHSFDLINLRVVQRKITIITSERELDEIIKIDEALGSRIKEKCGEFAMDIERKTGRNWRLKGAL